MSTVKSELVPRIIVKEIIDQKRELERILSKFRSLAFGIPFRFYIVCELNKDVKGI